MTTFSSKLKQKKCSTGLISTNFVVFFIQRRTMIIHTVSESAALSTFPQSISSPSLNYSRLSCCIVSIEGQLHEYIELK